MSNPICKECKAEMNCSGFNISKSGVISVYKCSNCNRKVDIYNSDIVNFDSEF